MNNIEEIFKQLKEHGYTQEFTMDSLLMILRVSFNNMVRICDNMYHIIETSTKAWLIDLDTFECIRVQAEFDTGLAGIMKNGNYVDGYNFVNTDSDNIIKLIVCKEKLLLRADNKMMFKSKSIGVYTTFFMKDSYCTFYNRATVEVFMDQDEEDNLCFNYPDYNNLIERVEIQHIKKLYATDKIVRIILENGEEQTIEF